jgi:nucleotide-binding universal stress UspA family protein
MRPHALVEGSPESLNADEVSRGKLMNTFSPLNVTTGVSLRLADMNFTRVLVPVDFSVCTLETLSYAKTLAEKFNVVVDVLHVIQPSPGRPESAMPGTSLFRTLIEGTRLELKKLVGILWTNEALSAVSIRVLEGRADEVILREADTTHAALIIMGMRHRSWMSRLLRRHTVKHVRGDPPAAGPAQGFSRHVRRRGQDLRDAGSRPARVRCRTRRGHRLPRNARAQGDGRAGRRSAGHSPPA